MPVELQLIRASDFVRLDPLKNLDFEASKGALQNLAHACQKRGIGRAALDLRSLPIPPKPQFSINELAALVRTFRAAGFSRRHRLAVLYNIDIHGGIRDFAFISRMSGLQVRAFTSFETAFHWLSDGQEPDETLTRGDLVRISKPSKKVHLNASEKRIGPGIEKSTSAKKHRIQINRTAQ
jgi:hypothetical protein